MAEPDRPQIYLITPPEISLASFPDRLAQVMDAVEIACLRMGLATRDEDQVMRAADVLRGVAHARDVPLVIEHHVQLAERLGLDGVHLTDGARSVRAARKALGGDAIVGTFCGSSRHDGMTAAEAGADYVAFGPVTGSTLGDGRLAEPDLFAWWSEMIEVPVVAEQGMSPEAAAALAGSTDFIGIGQEIWDQDSPTPALEEIVARLG